jgi:hypothetical protein
METNKRSINSILKPLGVKLLAARCGNRYLGYSYFVSLVTGYQVGESVLVYRQNDMTREQWLKRAKYEISRAS